MFSALIPPLIIHKVGKRACLMSSAFGMSMCFLAIALGIRAGTFGASIVAIIAFFLYYTFFAIGWLAVCCSTEPMHLKPL
jgi:hypothetical protein